MNMCNILPWLCVDALINCSTVYLKTMSHMATEKGVEPFKENLQMPGEFKSPSIIKVVIACNL